MLPRKARRNRCAVILLLWFVVCAAASGAPPASLVVHGPGAGTIALDGPWQFHPGDDAAWAVPGFDDAGWTQISAGEPWGAQGFPAMEGMGWYRKHIVLDPGAAGPGDLALLIPVVDDAYEVYWNGVRVGTFGKLPPHPVALNAPQPAQTFGLGQATSGVLALRVWKAPLFSNDPAELGGFEAVPVLGGGAAIAARKAQLDYGWMRRNQFQFGLISLYVLVSLLSLLVWMRDRQQMLLAWMSIYTIIPLARLLLGILRLPISTNLAQGLLQPAIMAQDVSLWLLLLWLLQLNESRRLARTVRQVSKIFALAFVLDGIVVLLWGLHPYEHSLQIVDGILTAIFTPLEVMPLVIVGVAIARRERLELSRWLVAGFAFLSEMAYVVRNLSSQFKRFTHWTLDDKLITPLFTLNGNPISFQTLVTTLLLVAIVYAVVRYSVQERQQQVQLEREIQNAREVQQVLVPETLPVVPGFSVTSAYRPAQQVGGDFFQIIPLEDGSTLVVLGDVSGKGLRAAMAVSLIVGAVRALADDYPGPGVLLGQLNKRLFGRLQGGFATCVIARISSGSECTLASAGHPAPYLNGHEVQLMGALPLGIEPEAVYEDLRLNLQVGDYFSLYTDGLLEARNPAGEIYSFARLESLFASNPDAARATQAAVNFGQDDDITVLTLTRMAAGEAGSAKMVPTGLETAGA
ncbi:MAG: SpoIIE family protein phosphatase [Terracidiphilus sp.]|nr:SpoIIE family protein phosphatase [Terracidiphilus sp.]